MKKEEIIKHYKTLLPCEQFVVTGGYALQRIGLTDKSDDIDIVLVNPTEEAKNSLERLQKEYPAKTTPSPGGKLLAIFMHEQIKIDVFEENKKIETLTVDGFEISTVKKIVEAKKRMNRSKDWIQLLSISRKIITKTEFYRYVDKL
jgi:23S rRNA A1618 N6-methylase RlmF